MNNKKILIKTLSVLGVIVITAILLMALSKTAEGIVKTKTKLPKIGTEPAYIDLNEEKSYTGNFSFDEDLQVQAIHIILVNTDRLVADSNKKSFLSFEVYAGDDADEVISEAILDMEGVTAGEWLSLSLPFNAIEGKQYTLKIEANNCSASLIKVAGYNLDIAVGFEYIKSNEVTFGEIFYASVPIVIMLSVISIVYIIYGKRVNEFIRNITARKAFYQIFNVTFLVLLYATICLSIYKKSYVDSIFISADSDDYMREAVNLLNGKVFSYEGLAGYKSHFANWPIVYPALIAGAMFVFGTNAYLAAKIVTFFIFAIIFGVLNFEFKEKAWIYALAFTNAGFLAICNYAWSEIPFMLFLLLFVVSFEKVVKDRGETKGNYVFMTLWGSLAFFTRYFGIFLWFIVGGYFLLIICKLLLTDKSDKKFIVKKATYLLVSMFLFGIAGGSYLLMNKINNGYPTGVSRGTWWDDYLSLTNDLIDSILAEIFNVFSIDIPQNISELSPEVSVWFIILLLVIMTYLSIKCEKKSLFGTLAIIFGVSYYLIFIVVRYRSSMDTFYYRFFAPATILIVIGLINLAIENGILGEHFLKILGGFVFGVTLIILAGVLKEVPLWTDEASAYEIQTAEWDEQYACIPYKSVIIWNDMDYRSSWYRPDVYSGELFEGDTWESLKSRYYASEYICMKSDDAKAIIADNYYDYGILEKLKKAIADSNGQDKYIVLKNE